MMSAGWTYLEFEVELVDDDGVTLVPRVWRRFQLRRTASLGELRETLIDMCVWEEGFDDRFERSGEEIGRDEGVSSLEGAATEWFYAGWRHRIECVDSGEWAAPHWQQFVDGERAFPLAEMAVGEFLAADEFTAPNWEPDVVELAYIELHCEHSGEELARVRQELRRQLARLRAGLPAKFNETWYLHHDRKLSQSAEGALAQVVPCDRLYCTCRSVAITTEEQGPAWIHVDTGELQIDGTWSPDSPLLAVRESGSFLEELGVLLARAVGEDLHPGEPLFIPTTVEAMVCPDEVVQVARRDAYIVDGERWYALDFHCSDPDCRECEVGVTFMSTKQEIAGDVRLAIRGRSRPRFEPAGPSYGRRLQQLWTALIKRHGEPKKHFKQRNRQVKEAMRFHLGI